MIELFPTREIMVSFGVLEVRWYGVLYLVALGLVWWLLPRLQKYRGLKLSRDDWSFLLTWGLAGVLVGGRLGYVVFYDFKYYLEHVTEILSLWQGGMSIHGGVIGVGVALWLASKSKRIDYWRLMDVIVAPAALGIAIGRIGNVINQELFATLLAQLVGVGINVLIAGVLFLYLRKSVRDGVVTALFLILYGIVRFGMEYIREQDYSLLVSLTRGQWLAMMMLVAGVSLIITKVKSINKRIDY
jgi:phosphatidylglycerol:prolipoprotein diacylglycerol transferase